MKEYNPETAKPTKRYIQKDDVVGVTWILAYEPYFKKHVFVALISHKNKEVHACHGYWAPHGHGKVSRAYAKRIGYTWIGTVKRNHS